MELQSDYSKISHLLETDDIVEIAFTEGDNDDRQYGGRNGYDPWDDPGTSIGFRSEDNNDEYERDIYRIFQKARDYRKRLIDDGTMYGGENGKPEKKKRKANPVLLAIIELARELRKNQDYAKMKWSDLVKLAGGVWKGSKEALNISESHHLGPEDLDRLKQKSRELMKDDVYVKSLIKTEKALEKYVEDSEGQKGGFLMKTFFY